MKENIAIHKDDSTLTKLVKFCCWLSLIACSFIFGTVWLVFFIILGIPSSGYKLICLLYRHHEKKKSLMIATRKENSDELHI